MAPIRVVAKRAKSAQHQDTVTIQGDGEPLVVRAWSQGTLPHEVVHYAVEAVFGLRGFVRLSAEGQSTDEMIAAKVPEVLRAEALTNAFQYELFGVSEASNAALMATLRDSWSDEVLEGIQQQDPRLDACRDLILDLAGRWRALAAGACLELDLD